MNSLVSDMDAGKVGALFVYGANPAYNYYEADKFKAALKKVKVSISFNDRLDETTELCKLVLPAPHFLESWGDAEPKPGMFSFLQPTIAPLFKTRSFEDSLLKWSGNATSYEDYFKQYRITKLGGLEGYETALQNGIVETTATTGSVSTLNGGKVGEAVAGIGSIKKGGKMELLIYEKVTLGTGLQANNPWLLEMPDPITRANWDNYAIVSPIFLKDNFGIDLSDRTQADKFEVHPDRDVIKIKVGNKEISLPVVAVPGTSNDIIAIAVGYGGQSAKPENTPDYIGRAAYGAGRNAFPFISYNGTTVEWNAADVSFEKTNETYNIVVVNSKE